MINRFYKERFFIRSMYDAVYSPQARVIGRKIRDGVFGVKHHLGQNCILSLRDIEYCAIQAGIQKASKVLDVCCGDGGVAVHFAQKYGCAIKGIDYSPVGIKTANRFVRNRVLQARCHFFKGAAEQLPFRSSFFNAVYSLDSLIHIQDKIKVLRECQRVLHPGGKFVFTDWIDVGGVPPGIQRSGDLWGYIYLATNEDYRKWLEKSGFKLLRVVNNAKNFSKIIATWHDVNLRHQDFLIKECGKEYFTHAKRRWRLAQQLTKSKMLGQSIFICQKV